ncbi:MAG: hypothetical protein J5985_05525, partial [Kiritimatiellae bacterium]|nr:hypothetical protein [Kiritimatiellia bacterium]
MAAKLMGAASSKKEGASSKRPVSRESAKTASGTRRGDRRRDGGVKAAPAASGDGPDRSRSRGRRGR